MLLVPIDKKIDWKHPPLITLLLIMANILIYVGFQLDDDEEYMTAVEYYQESGLAKIELQPAIDYAELHHDYDLTHALSGVNPEWFPSWVMRLQTDTVFMRALNRGEVIFPESENYGEWKEKRTRFDELYESITYVHYGLRTAEPGVVSLFSHMFLHAGFWHLFGNMIFLFAVGMLIEATMDKKSYFLSYMLAGLGSAAFDFIFRSDELVPGIGASGAIAGMMGAYAVLYGVKRIRFFYFIGVYFDYVSLPAIVLLPIWIGNELMQMQINSDSNVNFLAHVGGLCTGALIAILVRKFVPSFNLDHVEDDEQQKKTELDLRRVRELMAEFKPEGALPILKRLYRLEPDNREVLTRYYDCTRINPVSDEYHTMSHAIFSLKEVDVATDGLVLDTFNEYLKLARPSTRMSPPLVCGLAKRFIRQKSSGEAEKLVRVILAKKLTCPQSQQLLQGFIQLLAEQGRDEDRLRYIKLIPANAPT